MATQVIKDEVQDLFAQRKYTYTNNTSNNQRVIIDYMNGRAVGYGTQHKKGGLPADPDYLQFGKSLKRYDIVARENNLNTNFYTFDLVETDFLSSNALAGSTAIAPGQPAPQTITYVIITEFFLGPGDVFEIEGGAGTNFYAAFELLIIDE